MSKELSAALSHGFGWLNQVHTIHGMDQVSPAKLALSVLSIANTESYRPIKKRKLEAFEGEDSFIEDLLTGSGVAGLTELVECGVDVGKVIGGLLDGGDLPELTPDGRVEIPQEFLMMFADNGEEDCSEEQEEQFASAVRDLMSCTGWAQIPNESKVSADSLAAQLDEVCDSLPPPFSPFGFNPPSEQPGAVDQCLGLLLGDNSIGDMMRNIYRQPAKNCECLVGFGDAVPSCLIQSSEDDLKVPGSLFRKAACLADKACAALDGACQVEMDGLDRCLPSGPEEIPPSCEAVFEKCFEIGVISVGLPPRLTEGKLPDACINASKSASARNSADARVVKRYAHFYKGCIADEESDALSDSTVGSGTAGEGGHGPEVLFALVAAAIGVTVAFALVANKKFRVRRDFTPIKDCDPKVSNAT